MKYAVFSPRSLLTMTWWQTERYKDKDAIICDGSIRSSKTVSMSIGFILWSCSCFNGKTFAICGKTIESLRRNVITQLPTLFEGLCKITERKSENLMVVSLDGRVNKYYLFGGKDEGSAALIQGMTLAGVMFDEVALMPRSFVEQALARCSVEGSKFWFNCNPDSPEHWFYKEWIQKHKKKNALYLHFTMEDNNSLSEKVKKRYENMYSGVFYDRFIRGLWVVAEGLVYSVFDKVKHVVPTIHRVYDRYMVSIDYGTCNPTSMGLWGRSLGVWYRVKESYYDGRKMKYQRTDEEHYEELERLVQKEEGKGYLPISKVIVDPSAASFIACIRKHGRFQVEKANNAVIDGIREVATVLKQEKIKINDCCADCIREFGLYCWDEKKTADAVLKENDHTMDDLRYFVRAAFKSSTFSFD
ncbi:MAG: PBSX family phage terminase large subunit [Acutalibacteraceae bacterium]